MDTAITISITVGIIIILAVICSRIHFEDTKNVQHRELDRQRQKLLDKYRF